RYGLYRLEGNVYPAGIGHTLGPMVGSGWRLYLVIRRRRSSSTSRSAAARIRRSITGDSDARADGVRRLERGDTPTNRLKKLAHPVRQERAAARGDNDGR